MGLIFLMTLSIVRMTHAGDPPLVLVDGGVPEAVIVIDTEATKTAKLAAYEFQHYVQLITGATLDIVVPDDVQPGFKRILIGESDATRLDHGLYAQNFGFNESLISRRGDDLIFIGLDDLTIDESDGVNFNYSGSFWDNWMDNNIGVGGWKYPEHIVYMSHGTLYAVHTFLEQNLGVRWYLPEEIGEVYPSMDTISVETFNVQRKPATKLRKPGRWSIREPLSFYSVFEPYGDRPTEGNGKLVPTRDTLLWHLRLKMGGEYAAHGHAFNGYPDRFVGDDYLDWWKSVDENGVPNYSPTHPNYHLPDFIDQVAADANQYLVDGLETDLNSMIFGNGTFSVAPNDAMDNFMWSSCSDGSDDCQGWLDTDQGRSSTPAYGSGEATRFVWEFTNAIAKQVTQPDVWLTQLAYSGYMLAPDPAETPIEPNVLVFLADNLTDGQSINPEIWDFYAENTAAWSSLLGPDRLYSWQWYLNQYQNNFNLFPIIYPHHIAKAIKFMHSQGVQGMFWETSAGTAPKENFTDNVWANPVEDMLNHYVTKKLLVDPSLNVNRMLKEFTHRFFGPARSPMAKFLALIERRWYDPACWDPQNAGLNKSWQIMGTPDVLAELGIHIEAARIAAVDEPYATRVTWFYEAVYREIVKREQYYRANAAGMPRLMVQETANSPLIDGVYDPAWDQAIVSEPFRTAVGDIVRDSDVTVRLLRDSTHLYLYIENILSHGATSTTGGVSQTDDPLIFEDERIEIGLDAPRNRSGYHHLVINTDGTIYDRRVDETIDLDDTSVSDFNEVGWTSNAQVAVDHRANGWVMEVSVPMDSLCNPNGDEWVAGCVVPPDPKDVWGLNVAYSRTDETQTSFLNPTFSVESDDPTAHLHDSDLYAILTFHEMGLTDDGFPAPHLYYGFDHPGSSYDFSSSPKKVFDEAGSNHGTMDNSYGDLGQAPAFSESLNIVDSFNGTQAFSFVSMDELDGHFFDLDIDSYINTVRDDFTVSMWFKTDSPSSQLFRSLTSTPRWSLDINWTGRLSVSVAVGGGLPTTVCQVTGNRYVIDDEWHHVVAMIERGKNVRIYQDGELVLTTPIEFHKGKFNEDLFIGGYGDFDGEMDEIYLLRGTYGQNLVDRLWTSPDIPLRPQN